MNRIIVMFNDEDKELNMSLYTFIDQQYRNANQIIVCHVTEEEYSIMQKQLKSGCLNERLPRISAITDIGYNKFRYVVLYDKFENHLLISNYESPQELGNYTLDFNGLKYNENGFQATEYPSAMRFMSCYYIKAYTTESYQDIINHYKDKPISEL